MTVQLVFLVEEESAQKFLHAVLPSILPAGAVFHVLKHRGKADLRKSIPVKLKAWRIPDTRFVVLHDQDGGNCLELKRELVRLCAEAGRPETLVRIVCQELESWYFGDPQALECVYGNAATKKVSNKAAFRVPDEIPKPSRELERLIPGFQKGTAAEQIPLYMRPEQNRSVSFRHSVAGVRRLCRTDA